MLKHLICALCLAATPVMAAAQDKAPPPAAAGLKAEFFARDPDMSPPQLSPDGDRLAWIRGTEIVIFSLEDETETTLPGGAALESVAWINNDYLVVYMKSDRVAAQNYVRVVGYSPLVVSREGKYIRPLLAGEDGKLSPADLLKPIIRFVDGPEPYVVSLWGENTYLTDVRTGKWKVGPRVMDGDAHYFDSHGQEQVAAEFLEGKASYGISRMTFRYKDQARRTKTLKLPERKNIYYVNFQYSEFDHAFYWSEFDYALGVASIFKFDMFTDEKTLYRTGDNKDMNLVFDARGQIVGVTTITDRVHTEWTDPFYVRLTSAVQSLFPKSTVEIVDVSADKLDVILLLSSPEEPDSYFYYAADTKLLSLIGGNYPELEGRPLAEMSYVTYTARDGLEIPAYITKRKDTPAGAPLIVMPHGGPASRDVYGFDYMAQYLASRGYVVLQPQYRGSAGFSDGFQRAGNRNLDRMVTDLEDGVHYLDAQGLIDPKKVCIVGWSWGGYLAQAALAFTPGTYACGVSGDGVSDLKASLDEHNDWYWGGYSSEYWRAVIGQPLMDGAKIRGVSPIEHIADIRAPLLLIHGEDDPVVSVKQSERMNAAMLKAGKAVTYLPVKAMAHGPGNAEQRLLVLNSIDAFVAGAFAKVQ